MSSKKKQRYRQLSSSSSSDSSHEDLSDDDYDPSSKQARRADAIRAEKEAMIIQQHAKSHNQASSTRKTSKNRQSHSGKVYVSKPKPSSKTTKPRRLIISSDEEDNPRDDLPQSTDRNAPEPDNKHGMEVDNRDDECGSDKESDGEYGRNAPSWKNFTPSKKLSKSQHHGSEKIPKQVSTTSNTRSFTRIGRGQQREDDSGTDVEDQTDAVEVDDQKEASTDEEESENQDEDSSDDSYTVSRKVRRTIVDFEASQKAELERLKKRQEECTPTKSSKRNANRKANKSSSSHTTKMSNIEKPAQVEMEEDGSDATLAIKKEFEEAVGVEDLDVEEQLAALKAIERLKKLGISPDIYLARSSRRAKAPIPSHAPKISNGKRATSTKKLTRLAALSDDDDIRDVDDEGHSEVGSRITTEFHEEEEKDTEDEVESDEEISEGGEQDEFDMSCVEELKAAGIKNPEEQYRAWKLHEKLKEQNASLITPRRRASIQAKVKIASHIPPKQAAKQTTSAKMESCSKSSSKSEPDRRPSLAYSVSKVSKAVVSPTMPAQQQPISSMISQPVADKKSENHPKTTNETDIPASKETSSSSSTQRLSRSSESANNSVPSASDDVTSPVRSTSQNNDTPPKQEDPKSQATSVKKEQVPGNKSSMATKHRTRNDIEDSSETEYEVDEILAVKLHEEELWFRTSWASGEIDWQPFQSFGSFSHEKIKEFCSKNRDAYKLIHSFINMQLSGGTKSNYEFVLVPKQTDGQPSSTPSTSHGPKNSPTFISPSLNQQIERFSNDDGRRSRPKKHKKSLADDLRSGTEMFNRTSANHQCTSSAGYEPAASSTPPHTARSGITASKTGNSVFEDQAGPSINHADPAEFDETNWDGSVFDSPDSGPGDSNVASETRMSTSQSPTADNTRGVMEDTVEVEEEAEEHSHASGKKRSTETKKQGKLRDSKRQKTEEGRKQAGSSMGVNKNPSPGNKKSNTKPMGIKVCQELKKDTKQSDVPNVSNAIRSVERPPSTQHYAQKKSTAKASHECPSGKHGDSAGQPLNPPQITKDQKSIQLGAPKNAHPVLIVDDQAQMLQKAPAGIAIPNAQPPIRREAMEEEVVQMEIDDHVENGNAERAESAPEIHVDVADIPLPANLPSIAKKANNEKVTSQASQENLHRKAAKKSEKDVAQAVSADTRSSVAALPENFQKVDRAPKKEITDEERWAQYNAWPDYSKVNTYNAANIDKFNRLALATSAGLSINDGKAVLWELDNDGQPVEPKTYTEKWRRQLFPKGQWTRLPGEDLIDFLRRGKHNPLSVRDELTWWNIIRNFDWFLKDPENPGVMIIKDTRQPDIAVPRRRKNDVMYELRVVKAFRNIITDILFETFGAFGNAELLEKARKEARIKIEILKFELEQSN